ARRVLPAPERSAGAEIARLLRRLDEAEEEGAPRRLWEGTPRMAPGLQMTETQVWDHGRWEAETTRVSVPGDPFCHDLQLSGPARDLLLWCDGTRSGREIAAQFAHEYEIPEEEAVEATLAFLHELAVQGLIEVGRTAAVEGAGEERQSRSGQGSAGESD